MDNNTIKILFIGDIVGRPGRNAVKKFLPEFVKENAIDYVFANGENLASGKGITYPKYEEMVSAGIDYFTSGNHIWNNKEIIPHLKKPDVKILRPINYPSADPGRGAVIIDEIVLISLEGRVFMKEDLADPFISLSKAVEMYQDKCIIVDFHAEATSEKVALGHYIDGKISALIGTHTHVQTADEVILPKGTAYISDVGMTGPKDSVIGVKKEVIIEKFLTQLPQSHKVASGDSILNAVVLDVDKRTKKAKNIIRVNKIINS